MVEQVFVPVPHFLTDWFRVGMEKLFHKKKKKKFKLQGPARVIN